MVFPYTKLNDAGALYFLGDCATPAKNIMSQSDFSEVRGNYLVERVPVADGQLIYTDEGASFLRFEENVCNGYSGMHRILSRGRDSRGNTFCNGFLAGYKDFVPTKWDPDCFVANNVQLRRSAEAPAGGKGVSRRRAGDH